MANRKITELNALTGANATDTDVFAIVDVSADETKKMTLGELKEAFDSGSGFVRITGDTMTGDLTVPNVVVSGNVDGRDVSSDGTKLDGIEAGADVTDTANVSAAGAAMETGAAFTGNVTFGDNDKAIFGAGSDLQIYSNGTNSFISESNATGSLFINASNLVLRNTSGEYYFYGNSDGAVNLYYDNAAKLATTSTGIDVTGTVTMDGGSTSADFTFGDNDKAIFGAGSDLQIYHDGQHSYISDEGVGSLYLQGSGFVRIGHPTSGELYIDAASNGAVTLNYNNSGKLATTSTGTAITGKTTTDELDLNAIAATISDTAVDIFVYDTRKDSDGGAWRKRTQGTSWYNETLNTATRGSRKEFPSVAVIVAETNQVTIYDGDDPDMPMWMVFNQGTQYQIYTNDNSLSSIQMLNGKLCWAGFRMGRIDFIKDASDALELSYYVKFTKPISGRNTANYSYEASAFSIVNNSTNDVAMTVLPNAPIDAATGLPVPTIAVATDGGVSVIKDDGTVVDITWSSDGIVGDVTFDTDNNIVVGIGAGTGVFNYGYRVYALPSSDLTESAAYVNSSNDLFDAGPTQFSIPSYTPTVKYLGTTANTIKITSNHIGSSTGGLTCIDRNDPSVSYITSTYNTGWMNGDIKLATLSDTDDTNVTGSELVTNGTFDTNTSGWTAAGGATLSHEATSPANSLKIVGDGVTSFPRAFQSFSVVNGKTYTVSCTYTKSAGDAQLRVGSSSDANDLSNVISSDGGTQTLTATVTATTETLSIGLQVRQTNGVIYWDNVSVRLAEEDRSVNGNGLQVFGTVTKSAVATGADLVAYSGFSSSNYLAQPYNSDLDFGTGDFCFMCWAKVSDSAGNEPLIYRTNYNDGWGSTAIRLRYSVGAVQFTITDDAFSTTDQCSVSGQANGVWQHLAGVRRGNTIELWLDGKLGTSTAITNATGSLNNSDAILHIGTRQDLASTLSGSIALTRISATAPSPEQILKIYNDEKYLFTEGAQATLYGSSDSVTALAYDTDSELLHVGTSAGRSVFQGLRRVDNTTTAVGAAISASNGLVADE